MRELMLDAAAAAWWVVTAPLRNIVADGVREGLARDRQAQRDVPDAVLKWSDHPDAEWAVPAPPPELSVLMTKLGLRR